MTSNSPTNTKISFRHPQLKQKADGKIFSFQNCRLFKYSFVQPAELQQLWVRDGRVLDPLKVFYAERRRPDFYVDCERLTLAPGFLDLQVNGAFGIDFTSLATKVGEDFDDAQKLLTLVAKRILQYGVTSFCPTLITAPPHAYKGFLKLLENFQQFDNAANILGAHFEGPFISTEKSGCHPKEAIISSLPDGIIESTYGEDLSKLAIITLAPELNGASQAIAHFCQKGVRVSIGHTNASIEQAELAVGNGANFITHLFCAMTPFHHRSPGIIGILPNNRDKQLYYGIITDGIHLAESAIQLAYSSNPEGPILITDCMSALGLKDGVHKLGSQLIEVCKNRALLEGTNTLAGSVASMPNCLSFFALCISKFSGKDGLTEALKAATYNPAKFLGKEAQKGTLRNGSDADFVLMDEKLKVHATFVGGIKCFEEEEAN